MRRGGEGAWGPSGRYFWPPGLTLQNTSCSLKLERGQPGSETRLWEWGLTPELTSIGDSKETLVSGKGTDP